MVCVHQCFQIRFCRLKIARIVLCVGNSHGFSADVADHIPRTGALAGGGFCFLRLPRRRVKSRLPLLCNVLQLGKILAVCLLRRHDAVFAGERGFDLGKKFL